MLKYVDGQKYEAHFDFFWVSKHEHWQRAYSHRAAPLRVCSTLGCCDA